ncbi:MAG: hypothetical protein Q9226_007700 [Calogaya cf. arnoldii]
MDEFAEYPETPPIDQSNLAAEEEFFVLGRLVKLEIDSPGDTPDALKSYKHNPIASLPLSRFEHNYAADSDIVHDPSIQKQCSLPDNDIGRWPRRLLHVPSMTSLEWQPGNIYGDHVAPAYSAVSYTWGRYDLDIPGAKRQKKYKNVKGVEIMGIDWPVPRINPDQHFHVDHFYNLIKQTYAAVSFAKANKQASYPPSDTIAWCAPARASLDELFIDPWFSSLWTLQEAFLCHTAYLVPLEASPIYQHVQHEWSHTPVTLGVLCSIAATLNEIVDREQPAALERWEADRNNPIVIKQWKYLGEVSTMLIQRGLSALASRNSIALYHVAQYRRTRNDKDRVYGIQQIFDLRLGASAPGRYELDPNVFNRFNLEDQLGAALVQHYPVVSQMHSFQEPADKGSGWRINASSTVPGLEINSSIWRLDFRARCTFSTKKISGQQWGVFDGRICDLAQLADRWRSFRYSSQTESMIEARSPQQVLLDTAFQQYGDGEEALVWTAVKSHACTNDYLKGLLFSGKTKYHLVPRGERQHDLTSALIRLIVRAFEGAPLVVLLLGSFADVDKGRASGGPNDKYHVGLILTRLGTEAKAPWKRLGFCIWQYEYNGVIPSSDACLHPDLLGYKDQSTEWRHLSDVFG